MLSFGRKLGPQAALAAMAALSLLLLPGSVERAEADSGPSQAELWTRWNQANGDPYELDRVERWLKRGERFECDRASMVSYSGTTIRYSGAVFVHPLFKERLQRFEAVAAEVAREVYGREPRRLKHYGAFNCRVARTIRKLVSEHALGNALDEVGFDFGLATKPTPLPPGSPKGLAAPFEVRVLRHWGKTTGPSAIHGRFLTTLVERLGERPDIFRSMFGPAHEGHDDHLHLDVSPWRYVDL